MNIRWMKEQEQKGAPNHFFSVKYLFEGGDIAQKFLKLARDLG